MDLRRMHLIDAPTQTVSAVGVGEYYLGPDRDKKVKDMLEAFEDVDLWNPEFQAWLPLLEIYLTRGVDPDMTLKYHASILQKRNYMVPQDHVELPLFSDILGLKGSSDVPLFENVFWEQLVDFSERQCYFFIQNRKTIPGQLFASELYKVTGSQLLSHGSWRGVMAAINLYRHCQNQGYMWDAVFISQLREKIGEWLTTYLETFDFISNYIGDNPNYDWYCDTVKNIVVRVWKTALRLSDRPTLCRPEDVYAVSPKLSETIVNYVANCPCVYDNPFPQTAVWNALAGLYFAEDTSSPDFILDAYFAMCVPKDYILRMCDTLYDFHWCVQDKRLPILLYDRKFESYQRGVNIQISPDEYKASLQGRGFPI